MVPIEMDFFNTPIQSCLKKKDIIGPQLIILMYYDNIIVYISYGYNQDLGLKAIAYPIWMYS